MLNRFVFHKCQGRSTADAVICSESRAIGSNRFPKKKIITIFEPISATARSSIFQNEFRDSLAASDKVIIAKQDLATTALGGTDLDGEKLAREISGKGSPSVCVKALPDLRKLIDEYAEDNAVLLILSNRTCLGLWESDFVQALKA